MSFIERQEEIKHNFAYMEQSQKFERIYKVLQGVCLRCQQMAR